MAKNGKKTRTKQYSAAEKNSFKKGFFAGLKKRTQSNNSNKKLNKPASLSIRHNLHMRDDGDEYLWAYRYARHMGKKFGLSDDEVLQNAHEHYEQSKRDRDMYAFLKDQYSGK